MVLKDYWTDGEVFAASDANDVATQVNTNTSGIGAVKATPTAVKTSGYTAAVGDLIPADATSGGFTVTLPSAPADKSVILVKKIDASSNTVTVQRSGSDVFNVSAGATSLQLTLQDQTVSLQYKASGAIWYVTGHGTPVAGLDTRYFVRDVSSANSRLTDLNGAVALGLETMPGAVNYLNLLNAATGASVVLRTQGADTDIGFEMRSKGAGYFSLQDGSNNTVAGFQGATSAVNLWWIKSSSTGNAINASALGADTDISIDLIPKGAGRVQLNGVEAANISDAKGLTNNNTARQSQAVVSGTAYYITRSNITLPNPLKIPMSVGTKFVWTIAMDKTAAGTGAFEVIIYRGTNGSTADTADVAQSIGTQTAAVDNMIVDVEVVVTATGASGSYYWAIVPHNKAVTATGFGVATGTGAYFSGTKSSVALNTASLIFGLGFRSTTGTPTITIPMVKAQAFNIS